MFAFTIKIDNPAAATFARGYTVAGGNVDGTS